MVPARAASRSARTDRSTPLGRAHHPGEHPDARHLDVGLVVLERRREQDLPSRRPRRVRAPAPHALPLAGDKGPVGRRGGALYRQECEQPRITAVWGCGSARAAETVLFARTSQVRRSGKRNTAADLFLLVERRGRPWTGRRRGSGAPARSHALAQRWVGRRPPIRAAPERSRRRSGGGAYRATPGRFSGVWPRRPPVGRVPRSQQLGYLSCTRLFGSQTSEQRPACNRQRPNAEKDSECPTIRSPKASTRRFRRRS